jgi:hypothetical protein
MAARRVKTGEAKQDWPAPSRVESGNQRGTVVYFEIGMLTEAEVIKHCELPPKALSMKSFRQRNEHGEECNVFFVSLAGLGCGDVAAMRKMKVYDDVRFAHGQLLLQHLHQICESQGDTVFEANTQKENETKPDAMKRHGRLRLHTLQSLKDKASEIILQREHKETVKADKADKGDSESGDQGGDESSEDGDAEAEQRRMKEVRGGVMLASRLGKNTLQCGKKKARGSVASCKKKARSPSPSPARSGAPDRKSGFGGDDDENVAQLDAEMKKVALKCKGSTACLGNLSVPRILRGERLGRSIDAARVV